MKRKWVFVAVLVLALGVLGRSQVLGPGVLGSSTTQSDSEGRFTACEEIEEAVKPLRGIEGRLLSEDGDPIEGEDVRVFLEPCYAEGVEKITSFGKIGAVWIVVPGYEPERVPLFLREGVVTVESGFLQLVSAIRLRKERTCTEGTSQFMLVYDDCQTVGFWQRTCIKGEWVTWWGAWEYKVAEKGEKLPPVGKLCTWTVVVDEPKGLRSRTRSYTFFHSDGATWQDMGSLWVPVKSARPATCEHCEYVIVEGTDGKSFLYHCERGAWVLLSEWETVEPQDKPDPDKQPGGGGFG